LAVLKSDCFVSHSEKLSWWRVTRLTYFISAWTARSAMKPASNFLQVNLPASLAYSARGIFSRSCTHSCRPSREYSP